MGCCNSKETLPTSLTPAQPSNDNNPQSAPAVPIVVPQKQSEDGPKPDQVNNNDTGINLKADEKSVQDCERIDTDEGKLIPFELNIDIKNYEEEKNAEDDDRKDPKEEKSESNIENKNDELEKMEIPQIPNERSSSFFSNDLDLVESRQECKGDHSYIWKEDLIHFFMKKKNLHYGCVLLKCADCHKFFSKAGYKCNLEDCISTLCESCGSNRNLNRPIIKCRKQHELKWSVDSWAAEASHNKSAKSSFNCNGCRKSYQEPAYTCTPCKYNLCIICSKSKGVCPPMDLLICSNSHTLYLQDAPNSHDNCRECGNQISKKKYGCKECEYNICLICGITKGYKMIRHPGLCCIESHCTLMMNEFKNDLGTKAAYCIACYKAGLRFGMFCVHCGVSCCLECADSVQTNIELNIGKRITNNNSFIKWYKFIAIDSSEVVKCSECPEEIRSGIYFYDRLNNSYCLNCVNSFN